MAEGQMCMNNRIIAKLDIKGPNLVKGVQLEGLRVLGPAEEFARHYYNQGADELIYQDVTASLYGKNSLLEMIRTVSRQIFIPLTVGGGIRTLEDIKKALAYGADKVAINTAAIADPELITKAVRRFGSSTIVISIEAKQMPDGSYQAFTDNGREPTGLDVVNWAIEAARRGAGEILLTSIDRDGTANGFDLEITRSVSQSIPVSVVASGGAGNIEHVRHAFLKGRADAVCVASLVHYGCFKIMGSKRAQTEGNYDFLNQKKERYGKIVPCEFKHLKEHINTSVSRPLETNHITELNGALDNLPVAIVDYGMGNLLSVSAACEQAGLQPFLCDSPESLSNAFGIIIPGVGAFRDAMNVLGRQGLDKALKKAAEQGTPILGICLGMQLLMESSSEFGLSEGLGLVPGTVEHLGTPHDNNISLKVPQIGWNSVLPSSSMEGTLLEAIHDGTHMYFVHSFRVIPRYKKHELCTTRYGDVTFCSGIRVDNITGVQFHPERSGQEGLTVYHKFANQILNHKRLYGDY